MRPVPPMVTPNVLRKARRFTGGVVFSMMVPPSEGRPQADRLFDYPRLLQSYRSSYQLRRAKWSHPGRMMIWVTLGDGAQLKRMTNCGWQEGCSLPHCSPLAHGILCLPQITSGHIDGAPPRIGRQTIFPAHSTSRGVCTENLIRVDDVTESPKL